MNLRDLRYLIAVIELKHFGKAAVACHVSQPTLSMQIKKLEETLGVALFERSNKQVLVTAAGKEIAECAKRILAETQNIQAIAKLQQNPYAGDFALGVFPTLAPYFLPRIMPAIRRELPKLKLFIVEEKTATLIDKLKTGKLDAALLSLPIDDEELAYAPLFTEPFLLAVPKKHHLAKHKNIHQNIIKTTPLLLLEEGHCLRKQALEACDRTDILDHNEFRASSLETLRHMIAAGNGITLMPQIAQQKNDGITYIPFSPKAPERTIVLAWRKTSVKTLCLTKLIDTFIG